MGNNVQVRDRIHCASFNGIYYYGSSKSTFLIDPGGKRRSSVRIDHGLTVNGQERSGTVKNGQERSESVRNDQERSWTIKSG